jgi:hypothetical protein
MCLERADFEQFAADHPQVVDQIRELGEVRLLDTIYTLA